jgi:predicted dienelactone hydrolase
MRFTTALVFTCLGLLSAPAHAAGDFITVADFEAAESLYPGVQPYTIAVRTDLTIQDSAHQRSIPILVRYPQQLVNAGARLPVVVWSHGGSADPNGRNGSREWSEALVRAGFVTVHFSLLARDAAQRQALLDELGMSNDQASACEFNAVYVDRPRDASAVISALEELPALVPELAGRLDLGKIVMAGHSFGAYTSRAVAGARLDLCLPDGVMPPSWPYHDVSFRDPRPVAFLALSPQGPDRFAFFDRGPGQHSWTELDRPEFMATGGGDSTPGQGPMERLQSWVLLAPQNKHLMFINAPDATHATFNLNEPTTPTYHPWVGSSAIAFLHAYVMGNARAAAWLHGQSLEQVSSGLASLQRK